ncbi:hypothetical protein RJ639_018463, partial [Escallonia herrerae]
MGAVYWKFNVDSCQIDMVGAMPHAPEGSESLVGCDCSGNSTGCHVVRIVLKGYSLPGVLPAELVKLPYLLEIDFAYNYLHGPIPPEWASTGLTFISVLANRLSGEIPHELGNLTTLMYLNLEANQISGTVPPDLGKLTNLKNLILSSNRLTGKLPVTLAGLSLTDFRINDNEFSGQIPDFIQNWKQLTRLEMHASGLEGPIPSSISLLENLTELRISDINGSTQGFPILSNTTGLGIEELQDFWSDPCIYLEYEESGDVVSTIWAQ